MWFNYFIGLVGWGVWEKLTTASERFLIVVLAVVSSVWALDSSFLSPSDMLVSCDEVMVLEIGCRYFTSFMVVVVAKTLPLLIITYS